MLISKTPALEVYRLFGHNPLRNYSFILWLKATSRAVFIDPWDGEEALAEAERLGAQPWAVLNTHGHPDHTRGNETLLRFGVELHQTWESLGLATEIPGETWEMPGHTMDHRVFFLRDGLNEHLFAGDTLFQAGVGNCKNGGDPSRLYASLQILKSKLSGETWIHAGHDYIERNVAFALSVEPSNKALQELSQDLPKSKTYQRLPMCWSDECQINPFLRLSSSEIRERLAMPTADDEMVFKILRQRRDAW